MRLSTGVDIILISRLLEMKPEIRARFLKRVFTARELAEVGDSPQSLVGRFAAKEAVAKALGCGIGPLGWQSIEVLRGAAGEPLLQLHEAAQARAGELGLTTWSLSISHSAEHAVAFVVAVGD
jgi:holo-[acyl-carrier protein] synthase